MPSLIRKSDGIPTLRSEKNEKMDPKAGHDNSITSSASTHSEITSLSKKFFERPLSNCLDLSEPVAQPLHPILPRIRQAKDARDMGKTVRKMQRLPPIREALKAESHESKIGDNSGDNVSKKPLNVFPTPHSRYLAASKC